MIRLVAALVMAMGWSIRGRYGHCTGAMMPGALVALFLAVSSARPDWWRRAAILGLAGAIGWAFGGQTSYGLLVGYTFTDSFVDILYGYSAFVLAGAMWGAIGGGILGLALVMPRSQLSAFVGPLLAIGATWTLLGWTGLGEQAPDIHDTSWVEATTALAVAMLYGFARPATRKACRLIALLCVGWWLGLAVLTLLLGLQLNPPRGDSWAGCLGVAVTLLVYLWKTENRAALLLARYGLLFGGIGFLLGDFLQVLQRSEWGPFQYAVLQELGGWSKMEMLFGFIMGWGIAQGFERFAQRGLAAGVEDDQRGYLNEFAVWFLLAPMMAWNFGKNIPRWEEAHVFADHFLGISGRSWAAFYGAILAALVLFTLFRQRRQPLAWVPASSLGKGQLLFLILLWGILVASFAGSLPTLASPSVGTAEIFYLLCASAATLALLLHSSQGKPAGKRSQTASDPIWNPTWRYWAGCMVVPLLVVLLAWVSTSIATPTKDPSFYRFPRAALHE